MDNVNEYAAYPDHFGFWQLRRPWLQVIVTLDGDQRSESCQFIENRLRPDVSAMNDVVACAGKYLGFGPQQTVGVRHYPHPQCFAGIHRRTLRHRANATQTSRSTLQLQKNCGAFIGPRRNFHSRRINRKPNAPNGPAHGANAARVVPNGPEPSGIRGARAPSGPQSKRAHGYHWVPDRKSTRLNSSHQIISYAVFCLKKKNEIYAYL